MTKAQLRTRSYRRSALALLAGFLILLGLMSGGIISNQYRGVLISVFIYILLATSLNLTTGALGELVLGHAGFMSIGAYTAALVTMHLELPGMIEFPLALLIGGGVGVPPLYELAKQYRRIDRKVDVVLGFNDAQSVFYADEFAALGCAVHVATMDGSAGVKGTVIDAIDAAGIQIDFVCSCGPVPMLKAVEARYSRGYMSFESRMACGIGACMACVAKDRKEADLYHRICKEGPVFPIGKVEF